METIILTIIGLLFNAVSSAAAWWSARLARKNIEESDKNNKENLKAQAAALAKQAKMNDKIGYIECIPEFYTASSVLLQAIEDLNREDIGYTDFLHSKQYFDKAYFKLNIVLNSKSKESKFYSSFQKLHKDLDDYFCHLKEGAFYRGKIEDDFKIYQKESAAFMDTL